MLHQYFLQNPVLLLVPWLLQSLAYYMLLGKMGLRRRLAVIPFLADHEFTTVLFERTRTFWRPFIIAAVFVAGAYYLGPQETTGYFYMIIAMLVYGVFLLKLYRRLAKSFGKGIPYTLFIWIFPLPGLLLLARKSNVYTPPELKPVKDYGRFGNWLRRSVVGLISAAEILVLLLVVGFFTIKTLPPKILVNSILDDTYSNSKDIVSDDSALGREDTMGADAADTGSMKASRDKFFPDHSQDKSVVVMEYVIGSNLEHRLGMASANIRMMQDATKRGDALTFVLEAGGSKRWFTGGIDDESCGRYTIKDGKIEKVEARDDLDTMESPAELEDFIKWTAEKYPADRYMLVLWDHGGGVTFGYGEDDLGHRDDTEDGFHGFRVSEIADSVKRSGVRFDAIGFDACLMQDIEIANALEPYADYYIGSEETEGGLGWYYTDAFGRLAEDPGLSSEDFGKALISTYDQFNTATNDGEKKTDMTLSFVDLTLLKPAYEQVTDLFAMSDKAVRDDPSDFADFGLAAMNAYSFSDNMQIDLVDLIEKLGDTDVNDSICAPEEREAAVRALKASVVYRNRDSAKGINGISVALPYQQINFYEDTAAELRRLSLDRQRDFFNDVFSIIAVQKAREHKKALESDDSSLKALLETITYSDFSSEEWYVKGFEDYDPVSTLVDMPLKDTGDGYQVELPAKTWGIVADCVTEVYQKTEDGTLRYIGSDHIGGNDENGHPMVDMGDSWVHMNDRLVCYQDMDPRETDDGIIYTGNIRARLNGIDDIVIHVEWDPAESEDADITTGHITGYEYENEIKAFMRKGEQRFTSGDRIEFLFDYYDEEGKLVKTEAYGRPIRVTKQNDLKIEDKPLGTCDIEFLGLLTDVYQRNILTETLEAHIGD